MWPTPQNCVQKSIKIEKKDVFPRKRPLFQKPSNYCKNRWWRATAHPSIMGTKLLTLENRMICKKTPLFQYLILKYRMIYNKISLFHYSRVSSWYYFISLLVHPVLREYNKCCATKFDVCLCHIFWKFTGPGITLC